MRSCLEMVTQAQWGVWPKKTLWINSGYVYVFQCECFCVDPTLCCDLRSKHSHKSSKLPFSMIKWSSVTVKPLNGFKSEANQSYTAGKSKNLEGLSTHLMQVMQWTQVRI